ncbi:MAG TPA: ABC transporter substrate-binding protein [Streptosporangiaceae bacterium]|nr:ABC transporter substrate-binding protein [Streptosporangiaceae bacterium]
MRAPRRPCRRILAAIGPALLVAGCAATASPTAGASRPADSGVGPISFATGQVDTGYLQPLVSQWNARHPGQRVTPIYLPDDANDQYAQLVANLQAHSSVYDVMSMDVIWTAEFASNGWITPLDDSVIPAGQILRPAVETATYEGHLYAVPFTSNAELLYYRSDILAAAHLRPPQTWAELASDATLVAARYHLGGYGGQFQSYEGLTVNFAEAVQSAGGSLVSDGAPAVDTPEASQALAFLVSGFQQGWIPPAALGWNEEASRRAFEAGTLLFLVNWPYVYGDASLAGPGNVVAGKFGVTTLPGLHGPGSATLGGANLAISAYSRHPATALAFIKFLTSAASERYILVHSALPPVWTSLYDQPALVRMFPFLPVLKQAILAARPRPALVDYNQFSLAISSAVHQALTRRISVQAALAELSAELRPILRAG